MSSRPTCNLGADVVSVMNCNRRRNAGCKRAITSAILSLIAVPMYWYLMLYLIIMTQGNSLHSQRMSNQLNDLFSKTGFPRSTNMHRSPANAIAGLLCIFVERGNFESIPSYIKISPHYNFCSYAQYQKLTFVLELPMLRALYLPAMRSALQ